MKRKYPIMVASEGQDFGVVNRVIDDYRMVQIGGQKWIITGTPKGGDLHVKVPMSAVNKLKRKGELK